MMKIKILIATHKKYRFPQLSIYSPIQVGRVLNESDFGYLCDDQNENISQKNDSFSELTALYWAWKNNYFDNVDYCGLVHYRRYFKGSYEFQKHKILNQKDIEKHLQHHDMIVPKKRNYYIETVRSHYEHAHHKRDLETLASVLSEKMPQYMDAFEHVMEQRSLYLFNMFVMKKDDFDRYMTWLFSILFEVEKRVDISGYDSYQKRVFGFLSERLFNVWLFHHQYKVKELKALNIEGENLLLKAGNLLKRKYIK